MLKAAIDIGSNSVRLLVADVNGDEFKPLSKDKHWRMVEIIEKAK